MDDYFIEKIDWNECTYPIHAIDFSAGLKELEELAAILEMVGMPFCKRVADTFYSNASGAYYALGIKDSHTQLLHCEHRIAPIPTQYINTVVPTLVLAHLNDPLSVIVEDSNFFINKKEEITPLLDQ